MDSSLDMVQLISLLLKMAPFYILIFEDVITWIAYIWNMVLIKKWLNHQNLQKRNQTVDEFLSYTSLKTCFYFSGSACGALSQPKGFHPIALIFWNKFDDTDTHISTRVLLLWGSTGAEHKQT